MIDRYCYRNINGDNDGRDNPYADPLDTKMLYTSVQKNTNTSSPDSCDDTTSQNLEDSQCPGKNSNSVDSSSQGIDNFPKPPNV